MSIALGLTVPTIWWDLENKAGSEAHRIKCGITEGIAHLTKKYSKKVSQMQQK